MLVIAQSHYYVDLKLLIKILVARLLLHIPKIVHPDQSGFISGRETKDNTIRDFNVVLRVKMHKIPTLFLSTDAEKAFDRVNWEMIWAVLRCLGLDNNMTK